MVEWRRYEHTGQAASRLDPRTEAGSGLSLEPASLPLQACSVHFAAWSGREQGLTCPPSRLTHLFPSAGSQRTGKHIYISYVTILCIHNYKVYRNDVQQCPLKILRTYASSKVSPTLKYDRVLSSGTCFLVSVASGCKLVYMHTWAYNTE